MYIVERILKANFLPISLSRVEVPYLNIGKLPGKNKNIHRNGHPYQSESLRDLALQKEKYLTLNMYKIRKMKKKLSKT